MNRISAKFLFLFILLPFSAICQEKPAIKAKACVKKDRIIIRFAPTTSLAWDYANQYGYRVEKYLIVKDNKVQQNPQKIVLFPELKPKPLAGWENEVKDKGNKYAAIAAQAIYGSTFQLNTKSTDMMQMINKSRETENRFSFALYAADQSAEAAQLMGLRIEDKDVKEGEKYLYRFIPLVPKEKMVIDSGFVFVDKSKLTDYPVIKYVRAEFKDKTVKLNWETHIYNDIYSGYFIERSEDEGKTWKKVNEDPYTQLNEGTPAVEMYYLDSIPKNNILYQYRIIGKSFFAEFGPPSRIVQGRGRKALAISPQITKVEPFQGGIAVFWELDEQYAKDVRHFKLFSASKADGAYREILQAEASERKLLYAKPEATNYLVIKALGMDSVWYGSAPVLYQMKDTIAPAVPTGLKGYIDTNGVVRITWNKNKENDLYGYRVYYANELHEEYTSPFLVFKDSAFQTTLNLITLTKKIHYKIVALDYHYNPSEFSTILSLKKPDKVAPSKPVFGAYQVSDTSISVSWIPSSSDDVASHVLFKSLAGSGEWKAVAIFDKVKNDTKFMDKDLKPGRVYDYAIVAIDEDKNESALNPIRITFADKGFRKPIENLKTEVDRDSREILLSWKYADTVQVKRFLIYRSENGKPVKLYKGVASNQLLFTDKTITINTQYTYRMRAEHKDGGSSPFTKEIIVTY